MFNRLAAYSPVRLCVYYSVYMSISSSPCSTVYLDVHLQQSDNMSTYLCMCPSICLHVFPTSRSIFLPYCAFCTCPSVRLYFYPSVIAFFVLFCLIVRIFNMLTFSCILLTCQLTSCRCILHNNTLML